MFRKILLTLALFSLTLPVWAAPLVLPYDYHFEQIGAETDTNFTQYLHTPSMQRDAFFFFTGVNNFAKLATLGAGLSYSSTTNEVSASVATSSIVGLDTLFSGFQSQVDSRESLIATGTSAQYWRGDKSWASFPTLLSQFTNDVGFSTTSESVISVAGRTGVVTLVKADVGLTSVDNTSDTGKPVSTAQQTAINAKFTTPTGTTAQYVRGDGTLATLPIVTATGTVSSVGLSSTDFSVTGSPVNGSGTITANLNTSGITAGTYSGLTVNNKGIATAGTNSSFNTTPGRSLTTSTGATGFQPSSTKDTWVMYSIKVTTTASIASGQEGYVVIETASTNSSTAGDWTATPGVCGNGQTYTLAIALQGVQPVYCEVIDVVHAGDYIKLRQVNISGTPTMTIVGQKEVQL